MKKSLSVAMVVAMVSSMFASLAFADEAAPAAPLTAEQKYEALKKAGVLEGDENGANLEAHTNRAQIAKILAKAFNLTEDASAASGYSDITDPSVTWATGYIGAVTKAKLMEGPADGQFAPGSDITMQELATVLVRAFGLDEKASTDVGSAEVDGWAKGYVAAALKAGLVSNKADFTEAALRSDLVYSTYVASQGKDVVALTADKWEVVDSKNVKVTFSDKVTQTFPLATALEAGKATTVTVVYKEKEFNGSVTLPVVTSQDISSAVALNSKVVEVKLGTAATTVDASNFTVKDAAGTAVAVASAKIAPYVTDGKTVIVTLGADTTAGTLYTLTSGSKSVNFGGRPADTDKPSITDAQATDANEVTVTFNESVVLDGATFKVAEKYGSQTAVEVKSVTYSGSTKAVLKVGDMKDATLYGLDVSGVTDFAGNAITAVTGKAFSGKAANANATKVTGAAANNPDEVLVAFDINVDPATITAANFKVEEAYGDKKVMTVDSARLAASADRNLLDNGTVGSPGYKMYAVLSVKDLKDATLYKVTVTGVKTQYGKDVDSSNNSATFTGKARPTAAFNYTITGGVAQSNTMVQIVFPNKMTEADVENVANYAITEAYGDKATVAVKSAELQSDGKTVKLTVDPVKQVLYKLTVSGVKDIYGNSVKTDSSANVVSFSGVPVAAKISSIDSIAYDGTSDTVLVVDFNQNVGSNATDVSLYTIDNSVGYPSKVEKDSADNSKVKLTLPKLTKNQTYKLTVKGLLNADGVATDTAGVSATFAGRGNDAGLPKLQAAIATDNQTVKVYFDRDVTDSAIAGPIWDKSNNVLVSSALSIVANSAVLTDNTINAYQDSTDKNVLVIRTTTNDAFKAANKNTTDNAFRLNGDALKFNADNKTLLFAPNEAEPTAITVDNVLALNSTTLRVYFNQPVYGSLATFAAVDATSSTAYGSAAYTLSSPVAADSTKRVYDFAISAALPNTGTFNLIANDSVTTAIIGDANNSGTDVVTLKDENSSTGGVQQVRAFAGNTTAAADLKDVSVLMADEKTLKIYFPALMNTATTGADATTSASVLDFDNYSIVDGNGAAVTMTNGTTDTAFNPATDIASTSYSSTDNSVTLTLNKKIKTATNGSFVQLSNTIKNAVGTQTLKDGSNAIKKQFAISTGASAKVTVSSATYSNGVITIKLSQKATTATDLNTVANLYTNYDISVKNTGVTGLTKLSGGDVASVVTKNGSTVVADSTAAVIDTIEVTLSAGAQAALESGQVGKVEANTTTLTGINGNGSDADSSAIFVQK